MKILSADFVLPITRDPIPDGAVAIENDKILAVDRKEVLKSRFPDSEHREFPGALLMPGFVNCHSHLELTVLRGFLDRYDDDFAGWLMTLTNTRAKLLTDSDILVSARSGALEGIRAGVTCFADIGRFGEAGLEALKQTGLRGILHQETDFSPDDDKAEADFKSYRAKFRKLKERESKLVRIGLSPHAPYTVSRNLFSKIADFSVRNEVPLTIHAAESKEEESFMTFGTGFFAGLYEKQGIGWSAPKCSSIEYLAETGVLNARPLLAHCVNVSDGDLGLISKSGSRIAHCPKSNAKFGHGIAPLSRFIETGIDVGFGSDSVASNNSCDILEEGRFGALLSRTGNRAGGLDGRSVVEIATLGGARALGLDDQIGSLEADKQADLIAVSINHLAQMPVYDPYSALVFASNSRDVVYSMVAGRVLYDNGEIAGIDESDETEKLKAISVKLKEYDRLGC